MEKKFYEGIREIYDLLQDDLSKEIFCWRLIYNLTGNVSYLRKIISTTTFGVEFHEKMKYENKKKIIFGAGSIGKRLVDIFDDIKFECFVDNNKTGEVLNGLPIIDIDTLKQKYRNELIIISTEFFHTEILEQLLAEGFEESNIINIGKETEKLSYIQYFDLPELKANIKQQEIFVDGGCYNAKNTLQFYDWCKSAATKASFVYAWEPDKTNLAVCKSVLEPTNNRYEIIPKGLWSKADKLCFESAETASTITENGSYKIEVDSLDNAIDGPVTFIKMDVEGAEYETLLGAKETIKKYKPKLAICVYHKPEDIWELPLLIYKLNPSYRFYLRHYSFTNTETVLYAIDTNS